MKGHSLWLGKMTRMIFALYLAIPNGVAVSNRSFGRVSFFGQRIQGSRVVRLRVTRSHAPSMVKANALTPSTFTAVETPNLPPPSAPQTPTSSVDSFAPNTGAVNSAVLPDLPPEPVHNASCDCCGRQIRGIRSVGADARTRLSPPFRSSGRYKCLTCSDYDLCQQCEPKGCHNPKVWTVVFRFYRCYSLAAAYSLQGLSPTIAFFLRQQSAFVTAARVVGCTKEDSFNAMAWDTRAPLSPFRSTEDFS